MTKVLDECGVGNPTDGISVCMTDGSSRTAKQKDEEVHPHDEQHREGIKQNSEGIKLNSAGIEQNSEGIELNSEGNVQGSSGTTPESAKTTERDFDDQQWNTGIGMPEQWSTVSRATSVARQVGVPVDASARRTPVMCNMRRKVC
mmetsp:Transcript_21231/g.55147  ORF Transcript_21231/g.55147 Transcript_21231/m.55147 type:complete len:145 (+) Transcript_21231:208-642(+)